MAIRTVVTRGFGNGTFNGTIPLVVTRGYAIAEEAETFASTGWDAKPRSNVYTANPRGNLIEAKPRSNLWTANP